jgi:hypothetical protein
LVGAVVPTVDAHATLPPTQVGPAGDYFRAALRPGSLLVTSGGSCSTMTSNPASPIGSTPRNQIPTAGNPTVSGPLLTPIRPPVMSGCADGADPSTATASGTWKLSFEHQTSGDSVAVRIPKAGLVVSTTLGPSLTCTGTLAPTGVISLPAKWIAGHPSRVVVDTKTTVTIGGDCAPHDMVWNVAFTWLVTNLSHPGSPVAIS